MAGGRERVARLLSQLQRAACQCPAHSHTYSHAPEQAALRRTDYAFEMAVSNIRYGEGVSKEVGMDLQNLGARKVCVMTDKNLCQLPPVKAVLNSLTKNGIAFEMYSDVRVEPTDQSFKDAIIFAQKGEFDAYVAVGGGSVIDTCKAANLYASSPESDFLDYVNAPIGKGKSVIVPLKPLIAAEEPPVTTTPDTKAEEEQLGPPSQTTQPEPEPPSDQDSSNGTLVIAMTLASFSQATWSGASLDFFEGPPPVPSKGRGSPSTPPGPASPIHDIGPGCPGVAAERAGAPPPPVPGQAHAWRTCQHTSDNSSTYTASVRFQNDLVGGSGGRRWT